MADKIPLIIDCDPGVDDAIALLMAFASPELEVLAVTTAVGNVSSELTARNACIVRQIAGREDVPVFAGCSRPLMRGPVGAGHFHGVGGLGTLDLFEPAVPMADGHAVNAIIDMVMSRPEGTVTVVTIGAMTNLAMAMILQPLLAQRIRQVVAMGGARTEGGNITASAEFNIFADPHAAHVVFESGCPMVVIGLDATHQVRATAGRIAVIEALNTTAAAAATELLRFSRSVERDLVGGTDSPLHDPCTIAYLLKPELFEMRAARVTVETASPLSLGHTAVEFRAEVPNAQWVTRIDADRLFDLLVERLRR